MRLLNIEVEGMSCGGCVNKITNHFQNLEGVSEIKINLEDQTMMIICSDNLSNMKVRNDLIDLGYNVKSIKKM